MPGDHCKLLMPGSMGETQAGWRVGVLHRSDPRLPLKHPPREKRKKALNAQTGCHALPFPLFQNFSLLSPFQICYDSPYFLKPPLSAGFKGGQRRFRSGGRPNKQGEAPLSPQKWRQGGLANSSVQSGSGQRAKEVVEEPDGRTNFAVVPAGSQRRAAAVAVRTECKGCRVIRRRTAARKCLEVDA